MRFQSAGNQFMIILNEIQRGQSNLFVESQLFNELLVLNFILLMKMKNTNMKC